MEAQPQTPPEIAVKHSINWGAIILWPSVILLLYMLSWGPVLRMWDDGRISHRNRFVGRLYAPVNWAYFKTPLHKPLGMYTHLWSPEHFDNNGEPPHPK
jgi:hypothetical protein